MNLRQRDSGSPRMRIRRRALPPTSPSDLLQPSSSSCNVHHHLNFLLYTVRDDDDDDDDDAAFHLCRADFRKTFKEENPDAGVKDVRIWPSLLLYLRSTLLFYLRSTLVFTGFNKLWYLYGCVGCKAGWWKVEVFGWGSEFALFFCFFLWVSSLLWS